MPGPVQELYKSRSYPAMSHPLSDPAVSAVAAGMAGLDVKNPGQARILEIGCGSGHNLIPLAMRWPNSRFLGIDSSVSAVCEARELAGIAGVQNLLFEASDLLEFEAGSETFDFIIAHGFFSWVPDAVKVALFAFCDSHLASEGIATVSFNVESGWMPRFPVIEKVRAIQQAGAGDEITALEILRSVTEQGSPEMAIIEGMLAKGAGILPFDDFAPVNDPWSLEQFVYSAAQAGLRWLGESDPGQNVPSGLDTKVVEKLIRQSSSQLEFQCAADAIAKRTFRSVVLCRKSAAVANPMSLDHMSKISLRTGPQGSGGFENPLHACLHSCAPSSVMVDQLMDSIEGGDRRELVIWAHDAIRQGRVLARSEPVEINPEPPGFPRLDPFRLECARRGLSLVDRWHHPCSFPKTHFEVLASMDGSLSQADLAGLAKERCPELAFEPWLRHLAARGMFF